MSRDCVSLKIPKKADFISLARLATSGIAYTMSLNVENIEDIKVSIGEACLNSLMLGHEDTISLSFEIFRDKLSMEISGVKEMIPEELEERKERELGLLIIKSLMDEVNFSKEGVKMIKYIEDDN
ncbi:MAG: ATP-binding protein [Tissierellaceae bacterium]|nr:ATP-binding protein [Tissierellaceae bacterium]